MIKYAIYCVSLLFRFNKHKLCEIMRRRPLIRFVDVCPSLVTFLVIFQFTELTVQEMFLCDGKVASGDIFIPFVRSVIQNFRIGVTGSLAPL